MMAGGATLAMLPGGTRATTSFSKAPSKIRSGKSLLFLQQRFLDLRFGMFLHFNMATFQDREWGDPSASPELFNPSAMDTDQWAAAAKSANMTWGCLTTKHHDGFCIWPTKTKRASVAQTSHKIDVVRCYVESFRKAGLRVALYYSILDMRDDVRHFNITPQKIQMVKDQLTELFSDYGVIDALIIDGWDAPWSRITYEEMPFSEIYAHIKSLQPDCLVSDLNASQFPAEGLYYSDLKAFEQNAGQKVPQESDLPAFSCVTLTDGWFWKQADVNGHLKPTATVVDEWLVPLNRRHCNLILNAPPDRSGRLAPNVVARLEEIGRAWKHPGQAEKISEHIVITTSNLATGKPIKASSYPDTVGPDLANDGDFKTSWNLEEGLTSGWLEVDLQGQRSFNVLTLVEPIGRWDNYKRSRIQNYRFEYWDRGAWAALVSGEVSGSVTMRRVARTFASRVRLSFEASADTPHIADFGIYNEPA